MKRNPINYAYLATKYIADATFVLHDRSYEGLEWKGPGQKPAIEFFEACQKEEDRETVKAGRQVELRVGVAQEKAEQARAKALEDIIPLEHKIEAEHAEMREGALRVRLYAKELQETQKTNELVAECWHEISEIQNKINLEAEDYLRQTDWYVTREKETEGAALVPADVKAKRQEARERINRGQAVFAYWQLLRAQELPSREEIQKAIKAGGDELARMKLLMDSVALKFPKPRVNRF